MACADESNKSASVLACDEPTMAIVLASVPSFASKEFSICWRTVVDSLSKGAIRTKNVFASLIIVLYADSR